MSATVYGQDEATKNKVKVLYFSAEELYNKGNYTQTVSKIKEMENLLKGKKMGTIQNLKVKSYIALKDYEKVVNEMGILQNLSLSDEIIRDIASYDKDFQQAKENLEIIKNTNPDDIITNLIQKIKSEKKTFSDFVENYMYNSAKVFLYEYRTKEFRQGYGGYNYGKRTSKSIFFNKGQIKERSKTVVYNTNNDCSVEVSFKETNSVSVEKYSYSFSHYKNKSLCNPYVVAKSSGEYWYGGRYREMEFGDETLHNLITQRIEENDNYYSANKKEYSISFSNKEKLILQQQGVLEKLRMELERNLLL